MKDYQKIFNENEHLLDALKAMQKEEGYLTEEALRAAAKAYGMAPSKVYETATFYSMLSVMPKEHEHLVEVCGSTCCDAQKAKELIEELNADLPKTVKLRRCECLGRCDTAPNVLVDGKLVKNATCEEVMKVLGGSL